MFYKTALLGAVSLSLVSSALAQDEQTDETTLDTVIVEGSRLNQTETEIGSSVTIITAEDIDALGFDFAVDAIAAAPGVTVNSNGAFGGQASVRIRGAATGQTLVLIDGIPVNDPTSPSGGFNFARVDTENIERIEVLKGPQSTLWGTDAIGGVVSITTKRPDQGLGGSAFAEYGSFNTFRGGASVGNANDAGDFRLAITGTSSDGVSKADENNGNTEDDAYEALTLSAKGGLNLGGDARLSANVLWTDAEAEFDSFVFGNQGNVGDGDELSETEELSANISLTGSLFEDRLENLLLIGYSDIDRQNFTNGIPSFGATGDRVLYRYQGTLGINETNTLAFGVEREETTSGDEDTSIDGLFALYEWQATDALTLTGGFRVDDHNTFGTETTGRVAAAYNPNVQLTLRASWGQGFKAPTLFQLSGGGFAAPNPNLQPETSEAFDAGIDWRSKDGRFEAGITVFDSDIEDLISFASTGYFNEAQVKTRGIELAGRVVITDWLSVDANYAYIDAEDSNGNPLRRIPEHSGDIRFNIDPNGPFSGNVLVRHNGEEPNSATTEVDSWTRVDVTGSYDLNETVELFGRLENLFDEEYQQILGYGTPDLSGYVGVRLRY
ncbi:MAG: TonB-dependent receptor [Henriciella sp.]|nr:TonB-dependent receptor [Henriciella sp.]